MENLLADYWEGSGLEKGDTVLLHSSMKRLLDYLTTNQVIDPPKKIIDSLISHLGIKGTLILPLFNFDFPKSKFFSLRSTPSQMGTITKYARRYMSGVRTGHPIYPFFIAG